MRKDGALRTYIAPERPARHHIKWWQFYVAYLVMLLLIWWVCGPSWATFIGIFSAATIVLIVDVRARNRE